MRILLLIERLYRGGGTETHVLTLARGLQRRGHEVTIYTSGGAWVGYAKRTGLVVVTQDNMRRLSAQSVRQFASFLRTHRFDVIHVHETVSFTLVHRARRLLLSKPPLVFTMHSPYVENSTLRNICRTTQAVISVSGQLKRRLTTIGGASLNKVFTIPNGINTNSFRPHQRSQAAKKAIGIPPSRFTVGYAGRFTTDKIELSKRVSRVLKQYAQADQSIQVVIAGRQSRNQVQPSRNVKVLGHQNSMENFYNACDVVIGTGRVAAEALACGTPTIIIGTGGYQGVVTSQTIRTMIANNFGDHAEPHRPWTGAQLRRQMISVKRNITSVRADTKKLRIILVRQLTVNRMVNQVITVYSFASRRNP